ncbi:MAG: hypothetical protein CMJ49_01995 [Planctomycetaceae bacterium]|nr:hypothetical protein [Planctomycetaceae bacterium]
MSDSEQQRDLSRRNFIRIGAAGGAIAGLGALAAVKITRDGKQTSDDAENPFEYDLTELAHIDPALMRYRPADTIARNLKDAVDLQASADGRFHIISADRVITYDENGAVVATINLSAPAHCLALDDSGAAYVGFTDHVEVFDAKGARRAAWAPQGDRAYFTSLAVSADHVFIADGGNRVVLHYNVAGELIGRIAEKDPQRHIDGLLIPSPYFDVAVGPSGHLWVANTGRHRLEAFTFDGDLVRTWGHATMAIEGFCGCCNPCHFTFLPDGRFVTCEKGLMRVKVYRADGTFDGVVAGPADFDQDVAEGLSVTPAAPGVGPIAAADAAGRILVLNPATGILQRFEPIA